MGVEFPGQVAILYLTFGGSAELPSMDNLPFSIPPAILEELNSVTPLSLVLIFFLSSLLLSLPSFLFSFLPSFSFFLDSHPSNCVKMCFGCKLYPTPPHLIPPALTLSPRWWCCFGRLRKWSLASGSGSVGVGLTHILSALFPNAGAI